MDPYFFSDTGDDCDLDVNGLSVSGGSSGGGDSIAGDSTHLVGKLTESALSGAMFERKTAARGLLEAFRQTCFTEEDVASVIAVIDKLVDDPEQSIRTEVMEQLPQIALFCHEEGPYLDYVLPQHILPHIVKLLIDKFTQVRKTSQAGLLLLVERGIVAPSQVEEHVFPVILEYTGPKAHEDYRTEIAQFMSKLAPLVGREITVKSYLDRFCHLSQDTLFQVRRVCASSMGEIATVIGTNLTESILLPRFAALCRDDVWGVRKGCAEIFTTVSSICRLSTRKRLLTELFVQLLQDPSRWVRIAACQTLGPFITTFLTEESAPTTPELTEFEKTYLQAAQSENFHVAFDGDDNECERQEKEISNNQLTVIPRCLDVMYNTFGDEIKSREESKSGTVCHVNSPPTENKSEPMEIENDGSTEEELNSVLICASSSDSNSSLSFEERRKIAYDLKESTDKDSNSESNKQNLSSDDVSIRCDQVKGITSAQNPTVSISSKGADSVVHIHLGKEKVDSIARSSSVISGHRSSSGTDTFNTWQYWRLPIPDIELDIDMVEGGEANVHVRAKTHDQLNHNVTYVSNVSVNVKKKKWISIDDYYNKTAAPEVNDIHADNSTNDMELEISTSATSSANLHNSEQTSSTMLDSTASKTTVSVVGGTVSDVHRSYMNLYNATRDQGFEDAGFESLKLGDATYDDDSDEQLCASYPFGDDYPGHEVWGAKASRPRLLGELPKPNLGSQEIVPEALLEHFISLCQPGQEHQSTDSELASFCVYNLPAVVVTLGPQNWSLLRECYEALACNMQWKVRYTLASSLHEIAKILGPELAERDLVPFYNATVKDVDEVRVGILRNLACFVKTLGSEARKKCLETFHSFVITENLRNWRFRLELAEQLQKLGDLYEADEIYHHLCPVSMDLIQDRVSEVRKKALSVVPYLVTRLNYSYPKDNSNDSSLIQKFLLILVKKLGHSEQWVKRQAFAALAGQLVEIGAMSPTQFAQDILPHLVNLSDDRVPNVRLVVAQSLSYNIAQLDYFVDPSNPHKEIVFTTLSKLQQDDDRDVRYFSQPQNDER